MAHVMISAAHKSSGKTSVSAGIAAALRRRGLKVQPFKKGPDYIDPLWRDPALELRERHLGLVPSGEDPEAEAKIARLADAVSAGVDLDRLRALAAAAPALAAAPAPVPFAPGPAPGPDLRIAIARDAAFTFYYPGDLEAFAAAGAELVPFDTLSSSELPEVDGLFIGGGFPECALDPLSANRSLRASIEAALAAGMPAYAECGGLLYLARSLTWRGESREMVGVIPADAVLHQRPQGRGYVEAEETGAGLWPLVSDREAPARFAAHKFHYAALENLPPDPTYAYRVLRGSGLDGAHDGIVIVNLTASFMHLRDTASNHWVARFVEFVRARKRAPAGQTTPRSSGRGSCLGSE